jgi:hypothetical protein
LFTKTLNELKKALMGYPAKGHTSTDVQLSERAKQEGTYGPGPASSPTFSGHQRTDDRSQSQVPALSISPVLDKLDVPLLLLNSNHSQEFKQLTKQMRSSPLLLLAALVTGACIIAIINQRK